MLLAPLPSSGSVSDAQEILAQTGDRALPISGPDQVVSLINSLPAAHHQRHLPRATSCSPLPYPKMLKWMSCRLEGLPDRLVEALLREYATLDQLLPAALGQPSRPHPSAGDSDLEAAMQEVAAFLQQDGHLW